MRTLTQCINSFSDKERQSLVDAVKLVYDSSPTARQFIDEGFRVQVKDVIKINMDSGKTKYFLCAIIISRDEYSGLIIHEIDPLDSKEIDRGMAVFYRELLNINRNVSRMN